MKEPKRPGSWTVKNQQSKRRNADSDTSEGRRGSSHEKFKQGVNRKDHWASTRQNIPSIQTNDEDTQREDIEIERRRRRRRKEGDSGSSMGDGNILSSKADGNRVVEESKTRRVPRKLPLQSVEQSHSWSNVEHRNSGTTQIRSKTMQTPASNDAQNYCGMNEAKPTQVTRNGLHLETECTSNNDNVEETTNTNVVHNTMWSGQWHPPPDDVQPCSSKTIDPYSFA